MMYGTFQSTTAENFSCCTRQNSTRIFGKEKLKHKGCCKHSDNARRRVNSIICMTHGCTDGQNCHGHTLQTTLYNVTITDSNKPDTL